MVGEKQVVEILEKQFVEFLNSIEKYGLSHSGKMNIYGLMQNNLNNQIVKESVQYGKQLERKQMKKETIINQSSVNKQNNNAFNDYEESLINQYVNFFLENGIDAEMPVVSKLDERTEVLITEAIRRVENLNPKQK